MAGFQKAGRRSVGSLRCSVFQVLSSAGVRPALVELDYARKISGNKRCQYGVSKFPNPLRHITRALAASAPISATLRRPASYAHLELGFTLPAAFTTEAASQSLFSLLSCFSSGCVGACAWFTP